MPPSPYRNSAAAPSGAFATTSAINLTNSSIPAGTPQVALPERASDQPGGAEMNWAFPVTPGQYEVRLYFSEIYSGAFGVGLRTFSVQIEGATVLQNYDTYAEVGANAGVVKKFTVTSDATLNINFLHGIEDPAVKAIEILTAAPQGLALGTSASNLGFGNVTVGAGGQQSITLTNSGAPAAPRSRSAARRSAARMPINFPIPSTTRRRLCSRQVNRRSSTSTSTPRRPVPRRRAFKSLTTAPIIL